MKYAVTQFKSLKVALRELAPFVKSGSHLVNGRRFEQFGELLSREMLANWLLCVVSNYAHGMDRKTFTSSPKELGGDGIIWDHVDQGGVVTEHTVVPRFREGKPAEDLILEAIAKKQSKGKPYCSEKTLIVFLNEKAGRWYPNAVAKRLPDPLLFDEVWALGLQWVDTGAYIYAATLLDVSGGVAPTWVVRVESDFDSWTVGRLQ